MKFEITTRTQEESDRIVAAVGVLGFGVATSRWLNEDNSPGDYSITVEYPDDAPRAETIETLRKICT